MHGATQIFHLLATSERLPNKRAGADNDIVFSPHQFSPDFFLVQENLPFLLSN